MNLTSATLQVATILVAMVPIIFGASDLICEKVSLNEKSWLPNGDRAKTLTWRVALCGTKYPCFLRLLRLHVSSTLVSIFRNFPFNISRQSSIISQLAKRFVDLALIEVNLSPNFIFQ